VTVTDATSAAFAADAEQAAYFRATLLAQREQLLDVITSRHALREGGTDGDHTASRARRAEAEARYIDRMIAGLDRRFASHWSTAD
jgi:hypothetical protein